MIAECKNNLKELTANGFSVVDFYTPTCGPCRLFAPVLAEVESELPFINVIKVNLAEHPAYGEQYQIAGVPTVLFFKEGELCETHLGLLNEDELKQKIAQYLYS